MLLARGTLAAIGVLVVGVGACVEVPQEVRQTFAPAGPNETSYYGRRPDAPAPDGFVPRAAPTASAGPSSTAPSTAPSAPASAPAPPAASAPSAVPAPPAVPSASPGGAS